MNRINYLKGFLDGLTDKPFYPLDKSDHYTRGYWKGLETRKMLTHLL